jgi:hypothetical protein
MGPHEPVDRLFRTIVGWSRYAELFGYDAAAEALYLDVEGTSGAASGRNPATPG